MVILLHILPRLPCTIAIHATSIFNSSWWFYTPALPVGPLSGRQDAGQADDLT